MVLESIIVILGIHDNVSRNGKYLLNLYNKLKGIVGTHHPSCSNTIKFCTPFTPTLSKSTSYSVLIYLTFVPGFRIRISDF